MQSMLHLDRAEKATGVPADARSGSGPGRVLLRILETLDGAGIPYCVLHGYESDPHGIRSDVDCVISATATPAKLAALFHSNRAAIGAELVRITGFYFVFASRNDDGSPCLLDLHLTANIVLDDRHFYCGSEILESRRKHKQFWIPAARIEFCAYLLKKILKAHLNLKQQRRLGTLYQQDPVGCRQEIARFWRADRAEQIITSAESGNWEPVQSNLLQLRAELRNRAAMRHPGRTLGNWLHRMAGRFQRLCGPVHGLHLIFLGPDGAGKSSVVRTLYEQLGGAFNRTVCRSFPPELLRRLLRRPEGPNPTPHALPPRSYLASAVRAVFYWFAYYTLGYCLTDRLTLARGTLLLHDRHLIDAVVDPRRYRYGGPLWLLRWIQRSIPQSDLVILLDAPAEVLQARKQELPFAETARQREAYLKFVRNLKNGHVVDAAQPQAQVIADVHDIVLHYLTARIARRYELEQTP